MLLTLHNNLKGRIIVIISNPHLEIYFTFILEREEEGGGERERERMREILISCLPNASQPGIEPATCVYALTGN